MKRIMKQTFNFANSRTDSAEQKRVELHMHSTMSDMDGVCNAEELVKQAFVWGHKAVALTDHGNVQAFPEVMKTVEEIRADGGDIKPIYGMEGYFISGNSPDADIKNSAVYHITILVKNQTGLKNLYKLVSLSNLNYFYKKPLIPLSELQKYREGLLIGSACAQGELYNALIERKPQEELQKIAEFYDFYEIQPVSNNEFLIKNGKFSNIEELREINRKIAELAEKHGKLCAATGDVHFKDKEDNIIRDIILDNNKTADENKNASLFFRTTDEMLKEFDYLGAEKAFEVVIANTNAIADMIASDIRPIPKGVFMPSVPKTEEEFSRICRENAHKRYGDNLHEIIENRLERELELIAKFSFSTYYMTAKQLADCSESYGYPMGLRGAIGSMLIAFLSGITDINPLPPHYLCPKCRHIEFITDGSVNSGFDLPQKNCPKCGCDMERNGHDIPYAMFTGLHGWKTPDICLDFAPEIIENVKRTALELFGENHIFTAGTIKFVQSKTARGYIDKYCEEHGITFNMPETQRLINGCANVKRCTASYPGRLVFIPDEYDVYDFTPVDKPITADGMYLTHFDYGDICDTLPTMDVMDSELLTVIKRLEDTTGVKFSDVPIDDSLVYRLFTSTEPLGLSENIGVKCGTLGIPEFGSEYIMQMMTEAKPRTFSDLVKISGLSHGMGTWHGNARELIKNGICAISDVVAARDDIMLYLIRKGFTQLEAYNIAEITRRGIANRMLDEEFDKNFEKRKVPKWYVESLKKINYLFPKAHTVARTVTAIRIAWYKLKFPSEFYEAVLDSQVHYYLKPEVIAKGREAVKAQIDELRGLLNKGGSNVEEIRLNAYLLVWELMSRGVEIPKRLSLC